VTDEYEKRTVQLDVSPEGFVSGLRPLRRKRGIRTRQWMVGGTYILPMDRSISMIFRARQIGEIRVPERPGTVVFGGKDHKTCIITGGLRCTVHGFLESWTGIPAIFRGSWNQFLPDHPADRIVKEIRPIHIAGCKEMFSSTTMLIFFSG